MSTLRSIHEDLRDRLVQRLDAAGYKLPGEARADVKQALVAYLRVAHRNLPARPRKVHWSRELSARLHVVGDETQRALLRVVAELEDGRDMIQRLTRHHYKAGFNDRLFNDLGIWHLHLGPRDAVADKTHQHVMAAGGNLVLWVVAAQDDAFLIEVLPHSAFGAFEFAKAIYDNWPALLGEPLANITVDEGDGLSAPSRAKLRGAGLVTGVAVDGKVFLPGGFMQDGTSMHVVLLANALLNQVTALFQIIAAGRGVSTCEIASARIEGVSLCVGELDQFVRGNVYLVDALAGAASR